jgi:LmbE family N-acetylglucosaminyl deacetylase
MMGRAGNQDPRSFWRADPDEAIGRLTWLVRRYRPDVMTTYNDFGGYGHPDHIRSHVVAVGAFEAAGDPSRYPRQIAPEFGGTGPSVADGGLAPWTPTKLYEQAIPASVRRTMQERMEATGRRGIWSPPEDATREQLAEFEAYLAKMLVPDERITTRIDVSAVLDRKWSAIRRHVTQIAEDNTFIAVGVEGWREFWSVESYILRDSRVPTELPEDDLFAGIV